MGVKVDLEKQQVKKYGSSGNVNNNDIPTNHGNKSLSDNGKEAKKKKGGKDTSIYLLDSQHGVHKVQHRTK